MRLDQKQYETAIEDFSTALKLQDNYLQGQQGQPPFHS